MKSNTNVSEGSNDPRPHQRLERKSLEMVERQGVRQACEFKVLEQGRWTIFDGKVDSQSTKTRLFGLVPEVDGAQWIVDRLRTG
jgi:hypothetical protein